MPLEIKKQILRFEVSVDDVFVVEALETKQDLAGVKPGTIEGETTVLFQPEKQLATTAIVEHHV